MGYALCDITYIYFSNLFSVKLSWCHVLCAFILTRTIIIHEKGGGGNWNKYPLKGKVPGKKWLKKYKKIRIKKHKKKQTLPAYSATCWIWF